MSYRLDFFQVCIREDVATNQGQLWSVLTPDIWKRGKAHVVILIIP